MRFLLALLMLGIVQAGLVKAEEQKPSGKFELVSSSFRNNEEMAAKYTCTGGDVNPPLAFNNIPPKTKSLVVTIQDLDAKEGVWVHWLVYNIPPTVQEIKPNTIPGYEALNDFGKYNYVGPCPADENVHRYLFQAYALKDILPIDEGMTIKDLQKAMTRYIIAKSELTGTYRKPVW